MRLVPSRDRASHEDQHVLGLSVVLNPIHEMNERGRDGIHSLSLTQMTLQRKTRQIGVVCDRCSRLQLWIGLCLSRIIAFRDVLFDFFLPRPSLSTTSSPHTTRCLLSWPPLSLKEPTTFSPSELSCCSSLYSWVGSLVMVNVREPSAGTDVRLLPLVAVCILQQCVGHVTRDTDTRNFGTLT